MSEKPFKDYPENTGQEHYEPVFNSKVVNARDTVSQRKPLNDPASEREYQMEHAKDFSGKFDHPRRYFPKNEVKQKSG